MGISEWSASTVESPEIDGRVCFTLASNISLNGLSGAAPYIIGYVRPSHVDGVIHSA